MTTLIPTSQPTGVEAYEDMFKEITRKLYGDESAHGLYPHNTQVAQVAQLASGAPAAPEGGERSFTTLVSDRSLTQIDYETTTINVQQQQNGGNQQQQQVAGNFKSEEHLTTAFGLAALMQNGFPPPGAILNPVNFPVGTTLKPSTNISIATADDRWQTQTQQAQPQEQQQPATNEQTWSSGGKQSTSYTQKPFKKPKIEPQDGSPTGGSNNAGSTLNIPQAGSDKKGNYSSAAIGAATGKRYSCSSCPYTTDRRDLFTRHENIHKEEKPFHCYACLKQFNRADHVKKHFLRMHRDMEYEIAKTRKSVSSKSNYYNNNTNVAAPANNSSTVSVSVPANQPIVSQPATIQASTLNIPTATFPTQITIPTHHVTTTIDNTVNVGGSGHDIATINGIVHHVQHQQQLPHQQQQQSHQATQIVLAPPLVTIKQEKGSSISQQTGTAVAIANNTQQQQQHQQQQLDIGVGASAVGGEASTEDDKSFVKKIKGEKRFTCCYCPWSGADNWGLKRHLNTHTKPFVCMLCDYKAARSERLATHVFKVHNKKACNKCNYLAEDEDQLNNHQVEAHLLNMQAVGRNKASVTQDFHNAGGGNQQHSNNSSSKGINMLSLLAAASSSASCSPTHGSPSSSALASPTENAATGCSTMQQHQPGKIPMTANGMAMANLTEEHLSLLQLLATAAVAQQHLQQQQQQLQLQQKATSTTISTSPPANQPHQPQHQQPNHHHHHQNSTNHSASDPANNNGSKRRRKSSSRNDKENLIHRHQTVASGKVIDLTTTNSGTTGPAENGIERNNNSSSNNNNSTVNNKNINETIFDRVYKKPYNMFLTNAFCKPASIVEKVDKVPREENFSLTEFLRNHKEVSISSLSPANKPRTDEGEGRLGRKQQQPRRKTPAESELTASLTAPGTDRQQIGDIRDKHMIRLITRKLCCRICQNQQRLEHLDNCHYHSKMSLILHNRWRHKQATAEQCKLCRVTFDRKYKLILHHRLRHSKKRKLVAKTIKSKKSAQKMSATKKKSQKQQKERKRKSKTRSGSNKRRK